MKSRWVYMILGASIDQKINFQCAFQVLHVLESSVIVHTFSDSFDKSEMNHIGYSNLLILVLDLMRFGTITTQQL